MSWIGHRQVGFSSAVGETTEDSFSLEIDMTLFEVLSQAAE